MKFYRKLFDHLFIFFFVESFRKFEENSVENFPIKKYRTKKDIFDTKKVLIFKQD